MTDAHASTVLGALSVDSSSTQVLTNSLGSTCGGGCRDYNVAGGECTSG